MNASNITTAVVFGQVVPGSDLVEVMSLAEAEMVEVCWFLTECLCRDIVDPMSRVRISTTVSEELLGQARDVLPDLDDASLFDRALAAVRVVYRAVEVDRSYEAYDDLPLDTEDEWGNLADFLDAVGAA